MQQFKIKFSSPQSNKEQTREFVHVEIITTLPWLSCWKLGPNYIMYIQTNKSWRASIYFM